MTGFPTLDFRNWISDKELKMPAGIVISGDAPNRINYRALKAFSHWPEALISGYRPQALCSAQALIAGRRHFF